MRLRLDGIDVDCVIGERPDERERLQRLRVDVELAVGEKAAESDELADAVDYAALAKSIRAALVDGYLRVALMYTDGKIAEQLRPEALAKSAQCFEKIGQAGRADQMRGELKRLYPNSPWAKQ